MIKTDVCIIGAGPAGTTTALYLEKMGISSVIVDKSTFPRHKACGEAMRVNVHFVLKDLNPEYLEELREKIVLQSSILRVVSTNGTPLTMHLGQAFSYMAKRYEFDNFLISKIKDKDKVQLIENQPVQKITKTENGYLLSDYSNEFQLETKLIVFAAGANTALQKQIETVSKDSTNKVVGVRAYFKNATFTNDTTHIFLFKELYGGYVWVFPLPDGNANIGLAMKSQIVQENKVNMRAMFDKLTKHERLQPYLKNATIDSTLGGATIMLPKIGQSLSGEGYMLTGDSGLAINPITGFGVGHAMKMGRSAAKQVQRCLEANDFSEAFMKQYDNEVFKELGTEVKYGLRLTSLFNKTWLVDGLIRLFGNSKAFKKLFKNASFASNLRNPVFIFKKLFFSRS